MSNLERTIKFILTGFPSPWRWARRKYWISRYYAMPTAEQRLAKLMDIDPEHLIRIKEL